MRRGVTSRVAAVLVAVAAAVAPRAQAAAAAPADGVVRLGSDLAVSFDAELRVRGNATDRFQARRGDARSEAWLRTVVGADLRYGAHLRLRGEVGTGQATGTPTPVPANLDNDVAVQQLFVEGRTRLGRFDVAAVLGRQEFAEGPRHLLSVGDGANLHRTWNGLRVCAADRHARFGAFALRATALEPGWFDDGVADDERLHGVHAAFAVAPEPGNVRARLEPFWFHSELPGTRWGTQRGLDERDTLGARLHGGAGAVTVDATAAYQSGRFEARGIDAWGVFVGASVELADGGWRPRLTVHADVASGGDARGGGTLRGFHQLYASSTCLGEGAFLAASNLLLVAPGVAVTPTPTLQLAFECGVARRMTDADAAYAGKMRPYAGTELVAGHAIGHLLRLSATWEPAAGVALSAGVDHLLADDVLDRAGFGSGTFGYLAVRVRT